MLGGSEYVAEACEETLTSLGHQVTLHFQPEFVQIPFENQTWILCTSTHGAGDCPDNIQEFALDLENTAEDLSSTKFFTIGIGDTSYDTFCLAAKKLTNLMKSKNCKEVIPEYLLDMSQDIDPEELANEWIEKNKDHL